MRAAHDRELTWACLGGACLALVQWFPAFRSLQATGWGDWQMIHHNWETAYVSLRRFGEWPLWDPFHCGGVSILRNPESQLYSPQFFLSFAIGTTLAIKLSLWAHMACAIGGMYWLARRRYRIGVIGSMFAAVTWGCSGRFVWDGAGGHATFSAFAFAPIIIFLVHRRQNSALEIAGLVALLVLTLFEGGTYPLPYFVLMLVVELGLRFLETPARKQAFADLLRFGLGIALLTGSIGLVRFVPESIGLAEYPRQMPNNDAVTPLEVVSFLTARDHSWHLSGHPFVWAEYCAYVGWQTLLFASLGILLALQPRRRLLHLLFGLIFYGSLMLGNHGDASPWSLLHRLPVYDSLRVPTRFAMLFLLYLALLAGYALDRIEHAARSSPVVRLVLGAILIGHVADLLVVSLPVIDRWHEGPVDHETPAAKFHLVSGDYYHHYASYPALNVGTPTCYNGGMNWVVSKALWLGEQPQARLVGRGRLLRSDRTPNRLSAEIEAAGPVRLIFDQNYSTGWHASLGKLVNDRDRLALDLPAGPQKIEVRYRPPEFAACALGSAVGSLLWIGLWFVGGSIRRDRSQANA